MSEADWSGGPSIALVLWDGAVGGAEVLTASLTKQMRTLGADASVVFLGDPQPLAERLQSSGVPYLSLGFNRGRDVLSHPRRYADAIRRHGRDGALLVECGFMGAALRVGGYRGAIVAVEHGAILELPTYRGGRRIAASLARRGAACSDDAHVAVSDFILERVRRHAHPKRTLRIYNGIDAGTFAATGTAAGPERTGCTAGFAGRLVHGKGADYLIRALALAGETHPLTVRIAGEGPERERLASLARALGVEDRVEFLGLTHDMRGFWAACDVAVVPSAEFTEACPMTPLEAMAAGKPVIATRNGGIPELVLDGETGRLVAPGEAGELAGALGSYAENPRVRAAHGAAASARVAAHFSIEACARSYLALFSELEARRSN